MPLSHPCHPIGEAARAHRGSTRTQRAISEANRELHQHGRAIRVEAHQNRRKGDRENLLAAFDLRWLHNGGHDHTPRRKQKIARRLFRSMNKIQAAALRLMILAIARAPADPAAIFPLSPEAVARELAVTMRIKRPPNAERLCVARDWLITNGWLIEATTPSGRAPGTYRFGARVGPPVSEDAV